MEDSPVIPYGRYELFGNLGKGYNEKQRVLAKLAVNPVIMEILDDGDVDNDSEQALQIDRNR